MNLTLGFGLAFLDIYPMAINPAFHRLQILVGAQALRNLNKCRVIVFGLGGIGSWCAEALVRNGIGHVALVDGDSIATPHTNRQLQASLVGNGKNKAMEMRDRLELIHNNIELEVFPHMFDPAHPEAFPLSSYDYVIDAMDEGDCKVALIRSAQTSGVPVFTGLDANGRLDPTRIQVGDLSQSGDPLWEKLQQAGATEGCLAVYSAESAREPFENESLSRDGKSFRSRQPQAEKRFVSGSAVHVTATFGMVLAGLVVDAVLEGTEHPEKQKRVLSSNQ